MGERKPIRWRRSSFPEAGSRLDTAMNRAVWVRDHGSDVEAWRDGKHLATCFPRPGGWAWRLVGVPMVGTALDLKIAKRDAVAAIKEGDGHG